MATTITGAPVQRWHLHPLTDYGRRGWSCDVGRRGAVSPAAVAGQIIGAAVARIKVATTTIMEWRL